jgi:D-psicose/D-tagatose/L-ribulose 3-epimerase
MAGKLGVHSLMFTDVWSEDNARKVCDTAAEIGAELLEVLIFDPATLDVAMTGRTANDAGVELRIGMALGPDSDISSDDADIAARGVATVGRCLEIASELGVPALSGITYAAFNSYSAPPTRAQWDRVAGSLGKLAGRAAELGLKLGLEPVNRYESFMVNTLDEAAAMIRDAGASNMFIHMDTFHMNIEEGDISGTIHRNAALLGYAHVADSNRGLLGSGHFDLTGYFRALDAVGYQGDYMAEGFSSKMLSPGLVGGVRLWRQSWDDSKAAAKSALDVMRTARTMARQGNTVW